MPPIAHPEAVTLWKDKSSTAWVASYDAYDDRVRALNDAKLAKLDAFVTRELPELVEGREPWHITRDEYVKIVDWKLTRGKNRPGLLNRAKELKDDTVREASTLAFAKARAAKSEAEMISALAPLTDLRGCGPATASAVMAIVDERFAFYSDEAFVVAIGSKASNYTLARYRDFLHAMTRKCEELNDKSNALTVSRLERALWSAASLSMAKKIVKKM
jgi:hypothetical protein